jgi:hypothetical protein
MDRELMITPEPFIHSELEAVDANLEGIWQPEANPPASRRQLASPSTAAESQWALGYPGMESGVGQQALSENNEFILWNYLVGEAELRRAHLPTPQEAAGRWCQLFRQRRDLRVGIIGSASTSGGANPGGWPGSRISAGTTPSTDH